MFIKVWSICKNWQKLGPNWAPSSFWGDYWWNLRKIFFFDIFVLVRSKVNQIHMLVMFWKFCILQWFYILHFTTSSENVTKIYTNLSKKYYEIIAWAPLLLGMPFWKKWNYSKTISRKSQISSLECITLTGLEVSDTL